MRDTICTKCKNYPQCPAFPMDTCGRFNDKVTGKRPRFCRLASSVDEMAEALVRHQTGYSDDLHKMLVASAKAWLMEVEE